MNQHQHLIEEFYAGFAEGNVKTMASCYHKDITFRDPAFGKLQGQEVLDMWEMLIEKGRGDIKIEFMDVEANDFSGTAKWVATYQFSKTNRKVVNKIKATFLFKEGLIVEHIDDFNIWNWSKQALGVPGYLLGWTGFMQRKIQQNALQSLRYFQSKKK